MKAFKPHYLLIPFIFLLAACSASLLLPTEQDLTHFPGGKDSVDLASIQQGYKLYVNKCSNCHYLYRPITYSAAKWKMQVEEMAVKAKITDEQKELILNYILTMRGIDIAKAAAK
jgi:hypothetical protein